MKEIKISKILKSCFQLHTDLLNMWQGQKEKVESDFVLAKKSFVVYSFENVSTSTNQFA